MRRREMVRAFAATSLLFLASGTAKPPEVTRSVDLLERPCDVPGGTVADYSRNILRAAQAAQTRGKTSIGESLMPCPLESINDAVEQSLSDVFLYAPTDSKIRERQEVVDILLESRHEVVVRHIQAQNGVI